jgi:hypothetical protein
MLKRLLIFLLLLSPWLGGATCGGADKFRSAKGLLGVVELGPFPKQAPGVGGYNLYISEKKEGPFDKINDEPVAGFTKIMVPMLNSGQDYYFRMTSVSQKDPTKESVPGGVFKRTAEPKKD